MYHSHNGGVDRKGAKLTLIVVVVHDMRGCSSGSNIQLSSANALTLLLLLSRTASKRAEFDTERQPTTFIPQVRMRFNSPSG